MILFSLDACIISFSLWLAPLILLVPSYDTTTNKHRRGFLILTIELFSFFFLSSYLRLNLFIVSMMMMPAAAAAAAG